MFCGVMICGPLGVDVPLAHAGKIHRVHFLRHQKIVEKRRAERVEPLRRREQNARVFQRVSKIIG